MKVHLIKKGTIEDYVDLHVQSRSPFGDWLTKIDFADWKIPGDIKRTFASADLLGFGSNRVVFDLG
jgi:mRNA interferase HigB